MPEGAAFKTVVLSWWSYPSCLVRAVQSFLSCSDLPVQADLCSLTSQIDLSRLTCPGCPVPAVRTLAALS